MVAITILSSCNYGIMLSIFLSRFIVTTSIYSDQCKSSIHRKYNSDKSLSSNLIIHEHIHLLFIRKKLNYLYFPTSLCKDESSMALFCYSTQPCLLALNYLLNLIQKLWKIKETHKQRERERERGVCVTYRMESGL